MHVQRRRGSFVMGVTASSQQASRAFLPMRTPSIFACLLALASSASAQDASNIQYGVAGGALRYPGGRQEQSVGAVVRWYALPWLSFATTPTAIRSQEPAVSPATATSARSGLTDIPVEASVSHGFGGPLGFSVSGTFAVTLPVGDTASGLGAGELGSSVSGGIGLTPIEKAWIWAGAGRSLTRFSVQSAFRSGTGWGDISGGYALSDRVGLSAGYSSDIGGVDSTLGRSASLNGGASFGLGGRTTLNVTTSRGISGAAPDWSIAVGIGTAFPYLTHLGAGTPSETLQEAFGGGTHGIGNGGNGNGSGSTKTTGKGKGRSG
jgi:hypothetical protein